MKPTSVSALQVLFMRGLVSNEVSANSKKVNAIRENCKPEKALIGFGRFQGAPGGHEERG